MNSAVNKPIVDFINDFKLLSADSLMHFKAKILYIVKGVPNQYECEVAIVAIKAKKLDAIYLLNSEIQEDGFEDMFVIKNEHINYIPNECLLIEREAKLNIYIFPLNSISNPAKMIKKLESTTK